MTTTPDSLFEQLSEREQQRLPPVDKWNPDRVGHSAMRIDLDGRWYYQGSEIQRSEMVRLFSTILRRDGDRYFLVTPAERLEIDVDDVPFVAVDMESRGEGIDRSIVFRTNVDDLVVADADHPISVEGDAQSPRPYVHVRNGLHARIGRAVYYRLIETADVRDATQGEQASAPKQRGAKGREAAAEGVDSTAAPDAVERIVGVWSGGRFFELGRYDA